jgi:hypothetical protein
VRVAHEAHLQSAHFGVDTVKGKKGEPPGSPFGFLFLEAIAAACLDDDGDDAGCACDGAGRGKTLDWTIVPGRCLPLKNELTALAEWFRVQRQTEPVQPKVPKEPMYVSRYISQGSEIPRGDIETQESSKVAMDSLGERINNGELCTKGGEGMPGTRKGARLALAGAGQGSQPPNLRVSSH